MKARTALVLAASLVAACATPLQTCISQASRDLARVEADIRRTEGNLARGYAVHRQTVRTRSVRFCTGVGGTKSNTGVFVSGCNQPEYQTIETPVAIDARLERRRLRELRERELALRASSQRQINQCYAIHAAPAPEPAPPPT